MATKDGGKSGDRNKAQAIAGRLSHLRNAKFLTEGFKSNDPIPSISEARAMDGANKRLYASQRPQPSVRS